MNAIIVPKNKNSRRCGSCLYWNPKPDAMEFEPQRCLRNPPAWRASKNDPTAWFSAFPETFNNETCGCWTRRKRAAKPLIRFGRRRRRSRRVLKK
jgi:hypothetical protein